MSDNQLLLPIIDAHVQWEHEASTPSAYDEATKTASSLLGFIAIEPQSQPTTTTTTTTIGIDDDDDDDDWTIPLQWLRDAALLGQDSSSPARPCLAVIPWAPVASGPAKLATYLDQAERAVGGAEAWSKIKGVRCRLATNNKPPTSDFVAGLQLLGQRGLSFEVCVAEAGRGKKHQLDLVVDMIDRAHSGVADDEKVTFILDHLLSPDLTIYNTTSDPSFHAWRTSVYALSKFPNTYMKLSGLLATMPDSLRGQDVSAIFQATLAWLGILLATFGPSRVLFGSAWPVDVADWPKWTALVNKMCWMASLSDDDRAMIWGGTAKKAYHL